MEIQEQRQRSQSHTTSMLLFLDYLFINITARWCKLFFDCQVPSCISSQSPRLHASNPNLSTTSSQEVCPESPDSPTDVSRLQEDFCRLANNSEFIPGCERFPSLPLQNLVSMTTPYLYVSLFFSPVHATLKSAHSSLTAERDRLKLTIDLQGPQPAQVVGLKTGFPSVSGRENLKVM